MACWVLKVLKEKLNGVVQEEEEEEEEDLPVFKGVSLDVERDKQTVFM